MLVSLHEIDMPNENRGRPWTELDLAPALAIPTEDGPRHARTKRQTGMEQFPRDSSEAINPSCH